MSHIAERRQEERDRRRAEIVDAAEALYAETGWDAITMDQVARRARLSRALVYVYFRDKADLHLALVERALDMLRLRFESRAVVRQGRGASTRSRRSAGRTSRSRANCRTTSTPARASRRAPAATARSQDEAACMAAGHRVHEMIVASLNHGVADGSIRADSATRTSPRSRCGRSARHDPDRRDQGGPDRARGHPGAALRRACSMALALRGLRP